MDPTRSRMHLEVGEGYVELLVCRRGSMVLDFVFHEGDPFPLHGPGNDDRGAPLRPLSLLDRGEDLPEVVAIDREDVAVEGLPLVLQRLEGHDVLRAALLLDPIAVDDCGEVVQTVLRGGHGGLPRLPDALLTVAHEAIHAPRRVIHPRGEREAHGEREALALRPRGVLDAGRGADFWVSLEAAIQFPERHELVDGKEAALREGRVPDGTCMALAQHEPVAIRPRRILGVHPEDVEIERRHEIARAHRTAGMAALHVVRHPDDMSPQDRRFALEGSDCLLRDVRHGWPPAPMRPPE